MKKFFVVLCSVLLCMISLLPSTVKAEETRNIDITIEPDLNWAEYSSEESDEILSAIQCEIYKDNTLITSSGNKVQGQFEVGKYVLKITKVPTGFKATKSEYNFEVTAEDTYKHTDAPNYVVGEGVSQNAQLAERTWLLINLEKVDSTTDDKDYNPISGNDSVHELGSDHTLTFTFKNDVDDTNTYENFLGIQVDGKDVDESNYTAVKGSVVVTFTKDYTNSLSLGNHTIKALFTDGEASANFTINNPTSQVDDTPSTTNTTPTNTSSGYRAPTTGVDTINITPVVAMFGLSLLTVLKAKKR